MKRQILTQKLWTLVEGGRKSKSIRMPLKGTPDMYKWGGKKITK